MTRVLAATLVAAVLGLAGCGPAGPAPRWRPAAAPSAAPSSLPPSTTPPGDLRLVFAGDVHFTGRTLGLLRNPPTAFGSIAPVLRDADLTLVNLESAVTARGTPEPKTYHFRAPTSAYPALRAAGIDAASIANNHALDYGRVGLLDTLDSARSAGFPVFGAGRTVDEAYAPWTTTIGGVRVAVFGLSQVRELSGPWSATASRPGIAMAFDVTRATGAVRAARAAADLVIVFMHWGVEGSSCPSGEMKTFASRMSTAGADIVLGTHAHTLLADGWLGRTYVHYGLGNFLWYGASHSTDSGVLRLTVRGRDVIKNEFLPATVSSTGQPVLVSGAAEKKIRDKLASVRRCTGLSGSRS